MNLWLVLALVALLAAPADAESPACWWMANDPSHPELSCTPLTQDLLTSLEGASRKQVVQAMGVSGVLDEGDTLRFESNYAFRRRGYSGEVAFTFSADDRVDVIIAEVDAPHHSRGIRFVWNANVAGCSDFRGSIQRCENIVGASRPQEDVSATHDATGHGWLPAWLRWALIFG